MKIILLPIFKIIGWIFAFAIGNAYSVLYFVYDPKEMIEEKKRNLETTGKCEMINSKAKWETDWKATLLSYDFWCPFINS